MSTYSGSGGSGQLEEAPEALRPAWYNYRGDFNSMTDEEVEKEVQRAQDKIDEQEEWLEAVASWKAAGKPRK